MGGRDCFCDDSYGTPSASYPRLPDASCQRGGYCPLCGAGFTNAVFAVSIYRSLPTGTYALPLSSRWQLLTLIKFRTGTEARYPFAVARCVS